MQPRHRPRRFAPKLTLLLALLMLAVTACGPSSDGGDAGSRSGSGTSDGGLKGDPIVVGALCSCTAAFTGGAFSLVPEVIDAWVSHTNDNGGINGHPVRVTLLDDAGNPAKTLQNAKKLVEQDKVPAILMATVMPSAADYLKAADIPLIGFDFAFGPYSFPNLFTTGADQWTAAVASVDIAKRLGAKKYGYMFCDPGCDQPDALAKATTEQLGVGYFSTPISLSQPDYIAQCLAAKEAGVDGLQIGSNGAGVSKVAGQCASQGFEPPLIGGAFIATQTVLNDFSLQGAKLWSSLANYQGTSLPGAKAFTEAMTTYAKDAFTNPEFTPQYETTWAAGEMFKAAAEAGGVGPTSKPADVFNGLYSLKDETLGGLTAPTTYEKGTFWRTPCYFESTIDSGKLTGGDKPICVPQSVLDAITKS
ncbi:ABC transporter substrate-binding protein [Parafrankia sp. EUN1f]|uniref:ABC transporter substrate-binding protein n=1 Tax=Parafrankia sp. EUN1f TaxID=102897 RepID=UPI0001C43DFC|nr:ABC transporter substrate-binding protein [Parafrankia sp. EUN1f]EFC85770.1 ABC-type branched-chain amino acid transport systems periplasmic component-like protein [Parafrankia sp. EUN1f]